MKRGNKFERTENWEERHDFVEGGDYMGNCHTGVYHDLGCSDINKMNKEHKVPTDNEKGLYRVCGHCKPGSGRFARLTSFKESNVKEDLPGTEICEDPAVERIFRESGCLTCNSHNGVIKMHPDNESGVRILGKPGKWWIYLECFDCGYQTALWKAQNKVKSIRAESAHA